MHRIANVELIAGGATTVTGTTVASTKSIIYLKVFEFGQYHIDIGNIITIIGFIAVVDGFRRLWVSSRKSKKPTYLDDE